MTRKSKRELENAVSDLEGYPDDGPDMVLVIGGDPEKAGWLTLEEYENYHGGSVDEGVTVQGQEADR